jgi:hypothetical protein
MTYDVSGEKRRVVVGAAARLAASQYAFAEALIGAETAGLSDARVATLRASLSPWWASYGNPGTWNQHERAAFLEVPLPGLRSQANRTLFGLVV